MDMVKSYCMRYADGRGTLPGGTVEKCFATEEECNAFAESIRNKGKYVAGIYVSYKNPKAKKEPTNPIVLAYQIKRKRAYENQEKERLAQARRDAIFATGV